MEDNLRDFQYFLQRLSVHSNGPIIRNMRDLLILDHKGLEVLCALNCIVENHVPSFTSVLAQAPNAQSDIFDTQLIVSIFEVSMHMVDTNPTTDSLLSNNTTNYVSLPPSILSINVSQHPLRYNIPPTVSTILVSTVQTPSLTKRG